jgi:hypothetical protein
LFRMICHICSGRAPGVSSEEGLERDKQRMGGRR